MLGDFNVVRGESERRGLMADSSLFRRDTAFFNQFIEDMELVDLPVTGKKYTWIRPNGTSIVD